MWNGGRARAPRRRGPAPRRVMMTSPPAVGELAGGGALRERGPEGVGGSGAVSRGNRPNGDAGLGPGSLSQVAGSWAAPVPGGV